MYVCGLHPVPGGVEVALLHLPPRAGSDRLAHELPECTLQHVLPSTLPQDDPPGDTYIHTYIHTYLYNLT